jgi:hypothetical protein
MKFPPPSRYPGYDVLDKRDTPSWDDVTRDVINKRMTPPAEPRFFDAVQWLAAQAICGCIVPQRHDRPQVPLAAMLDEKMHAGGGEGYRDARMPPMAEAWRIGLAALDDASRARHELPMASTVMAARIALLESAQRGELDGLAWQGMPSSLFFSERVLHDICGLYYAHPYAWSEIGFGGPANPRGYVRMYYDRRDPWEPVQATPGKEADAYRTNRRVR